MAKDEATTAAAEGLFKTGLKFGDVATAGSLSLLQAGIGYFADKQAADAEYRNQKRNFKLRVEQANRETAAEYGIRSIPTLMIFANGESVGTEIGALTKPQLDEFIRSKI